MASISRRWLLVHICWQRRKHLHKIEPPTTNPLTDTWTVSTVEIGGAALPSQGPQAIKQGAVHNTRFFYVRPTRLFCLDRRRKNKVAILKP